jgi:hypothetical protein
MFDRPATHPLASNATLQLPEECLKYLPSDVNATIHNVPAYQLGFSILIHGGRVGVLFQMRLAGAPAGLGNGGAEEFVEQFAAQWGLGGEGINQGHGTGPGGVGSSGELRKKGKDWAVIWDWRSGEVLAVSSSPSHLVSR